MKKKILASLVATMAVGATCAFAANPFVDVPTDSWAYKSVVELADAGIIQGVDGRYFQGERNITRYEAAEMTAKAMAHMDKASLEQRAMINKLADEYADELNSLGVRVSNLEKKVGNIKMTGDVRLRYRYQQDGFKRDDNRTTDSLFEYRGRLRANATINDNTTAKIGISTNNKSFDTNDAAASSGTNADNMYIDDMYVQHDFSKNASLKVGRWDTYLLGNGMNLQYGDVFDGIQATVGSKNVKFTAGYGEFKENGWGTATTYALSSNNGYDKKGLNDVKTGYAELEGTFNRVGAGIYYNALSGDKAEAQNLDNIFGGYLKFHFGDKVNLIGDYQKVSKDNATSADDDADLWGAKLSYGAASFAKKGTWDAWVEYINGDKNSYYGNTGSWRNGKLLDNVKTWGVGVDYTIMKNTQLQVMQSFASEAKEGNTDPDEMTRAQFIFVF